MRLWPLTFGMAALMPLQEQTDMSVSTLTRQASSDEIAAEMDRRGAVIEALEERTANAQTVLKQAMRLLSSCHSRIHCLPRTSDTELAEEIDQMIGAIRRWVDICPPS